MSLGLLLFIVPRSTFLPMQCENYTICLSSRIVKLNIKSIFDYIGKTED